METQSNAEAVPSSLEARIIGALVYADLFDYPLTIQIYPDGVHQQALIAMKKANDNQLSQDTHQFL